MPVKKLTDVMCDMETLGRRAGCVILSIGAVYFDPLTGKLGDEFYLVVNRRSCVALGMHEDPETLAWWEGQKPEAQGVIKQASLEKATKAAGYSRKIPNHGIGSALDKLTEFLKPAGKRDLKIWGNGSDFDNAILQTAYAMANRKQPWEFWNNRCHRTLKNLAPAIKVERLGTYHNALDDAKTQALHAAKVFAHLKVLQK